MRFHSAVLGLLLASAVTLTAGSAIADDDEKDGTGNAGNNWNGFYAGINAGFGKSDGAGEPTGFDADANSGERSKNTTEGGAPTGGPATSAGSDHPSVNFYGTIDEGMAFRSK
jgi:hypothetical protein